MQHTVINIYNCFYGRRQPQNDPLLSKDMFYCSFFTYKTKLFMEKITHIPENTDWSQ